MGWGKGQPKEHTYLQQNGGVALAHPRRCQARKHGGEPCRRYAIKGGSVCPVHGGKAPQVLRKARERQDLSTVREAMRRLRGDPPPPRQPLPESVDLAEDLAEYPPKPPVHQPDPAPPATPAPTRPTNTPPPPQSLEDALHDAAQANRRAGALTRRRKRR